MPMIPLWKKVLYGILLAIPLAVAALWMYYVQKAEETYMAQFLAPIDNGPVLIALSLFIVGYAVFLFALFYNNIRDSLLHKNQ